MGRKINCFLVMLVLFDSSVAQQTSDDEKAFLKDLFGPAKVEEHKPVPSTTTQTNMLKGGTRFDQEGNMFVPANNSGVDYYHREATLSGASTDKTRRFVLQNDNTLNANSLQPETVVSGSLEHSIAVAHGRPHRVQTVEDKVKLASDRQLETRKNDRKNAYFDDGPELNAALDEYKSQYGIEGDIDAAQVSILAEERTKKIEEYRRKYGEDGIHASGVSYDEEAMIRQIDSDTSAAQQDTLTSYEESNSSEHREISVQENKLDNSVPIPSGRYEEGRDPSNNTKVVYVDENGVELELDRSKFAPGLTYTDEAGNQIPVDPNQIGAKKIYLNSAGEIINIETSNGASLSGESALSIENTMASPQNANQKSPNLQDSALSDHDDQGRSDIYVDEHGDVIELDPKKHYGWGDEDTDVKQIDNSSSLEHREQDDGVIVLNEENHWGRNPGEIVGLDGIAVYSEDNNWGFDSFNVREIEQDVDQYNKEEAERIRIEREEQLERERLAEIARREEAERQRELDRIRAEESQRLALAQQQERQQQSGGFGSFLGKALSLGGAVYGIKSGNPELVNLSATIAEVAGDSSLSAAISGAQGSAYQIQQLKEQNRRYEETLVPIEIPDYIEETYEPNTTTKSVCPVGYTTNCGRTACEPIKPCTGGSCGIC